MNETMGWNERNDGLERTEPEPNGKRFFDAYCMYGHENSSAQCQKKKGANQVHVRILYVRTCTHG